MSERTGEAFKVFNPETGKTYKIWADGSTEGFGDATCIVNRIPLLIAQAEEGRNFCQLFGKLESLPS